MDNTTAISIGIVIVGLAVFAIGLIAHKALRIAATEIATLRSQLTAARHKSLPMELNTTKERTKKLEAALADIGAATEKGQNGTARMINRKVVEALKG
jgi:uncharacterized protein (DUF362 family)